MAYSLSLIKGIANYCPSRALISPNYSGYSHSTDKACHFVRHVDFIFIHYKVCVQRRYHFPPRQFERNVAGSPSVQYTKKTSHALLPMPPPSPPCLLPSGTNIAKRLTSPHIMRPPARCSRYFSSFCSFCILENQEKFRLCRFGHFISHFQPHPTVETIGPYLCTSMSIYTLCGSSGYQVPIKGSCTCSTQHTRILSWSLFH